MIYIIGSLEWFNHPFDCVVMASTEIEGVTIESSYFDHVESGDIGKKPPTNYFRFICAYFYVIALFIFVFLYGKYNIQELHIMDDIVKIILNNTHVDDVK